MFIWNGIKSDNMDLITEKLPPISISIPKSEDIEIEGMDGYLTQLGGYEGDTKEVDAHYVGNNPQKFLNWLTGSGEVIFSNLSDRYYKAIINNKIPLEQLVANKLYYFPIMFKCQPFGYLLEGKETIELIAPTTIYNGKSTHISKPIVSIYGTGSCTFNINNEAFYIVEIGTSITIDSDIQEVYNGKGRQMTGDFPILAVGENTISWTGTGITKVEIIPNWRTLI